MTVPVAYSWQDEELVSATLMNDNIRDALSWLLNKPCFVGMHTTAVALPNATNVAIPIQTEVQKVGFTHAANDSKVFADQPGWYRWVIQGTYDTSTASGSRGLFPFKNGGSNPTGGGSWVGHADTSSMVQTRTGLVYLNGTTDYFEMVLHQTSGASINTWIDPNIRARVCMTWEGRDA